MSEYTYHQDTTHPEIENCLPVKMGRRRNRVYQNLGEAVMCLLAVER